MSSQTRKEQKKREKESDFFSTKASFLAGIVFWITILKNYIELFITLPPIVVFGYVLFAGILISLVLGTKILDNKLRSRVVANFGSFLTVCSLIYFLIENSIIRYIEFSSLMEVSLFVGIYVFITIAGSIYLLKNKRN